MSRGMRNQCRRTQNVFTCSSVPLVLLSADHAVTSAGAPHVGQSTISIVSTPW
jgi:hypothetical protein